MMAISTTKNYPNDAWRMVAVDMAKLLDNGTARWSCRDLTTASCAMQKPRNWLKHREKIKPRRTCLKPLNL